MSKEALIYFIRYFISSISGPTINHVVPIIVVRYIAILLSIKYLNLVNILGLDLFILEI